MMYFNFPVIGVFDIIVSIKQGYSITDAIPESYHKEIMLYG